MLLCFVHYLRNPSVSLQQKKERKKKTKTKRNWEIVLQRWMPIRVYWFYFLLLKFYRFMWPKWHLLSKGRNLHDTQQHNCCGESKYTHHLSCQKSQSIICDTPQPRHTRTHTTIQLSDTLLITQQPKGKLCNSALGTKRRGRKWSGDSEEY